MFTQQLTSKKSGLIGMAGQGADLPTVELENGRVRGKCLDHGTCLASLLTCDGGSEELKKPTTNSKAFDMPAAILVTLEVSEVLGELKEADDEFKDPGHAGGDN